MDCLYHAYADHLEYLGLAPDRLDYPYYRVLKAYAHGSVRNQYTFGGFAPWIVGKLAARRGLSVVVQHRIFTPAHYRDAATKERYGPQALSILARTDFGEEVERITLHPAIVLRLAQQHAVFRHYNLTDGVPIMAIHLSRIDKRGE